MARDARLLIEENEASLDAIMGMKARIDFWNEVGEPDASGERLRFYALVDDDFKVFPPAYAEGRGIERADAERLLQPIFDAIKAGDRDEVARLLGRPSPAPAP